MKNICCGYLLFHHLAADTNGISFCTFFHSQRKESLLLTHNTVSSLFEVSVLFYDLTPVRY